MEATGDTHSDHTAEPFWIWATHAGDGDEEDERLEKTVPLTEPVGVHDYDESRSYLPLLYVHKKEDIKEDWIKIVNVKSTTPLRTKLKAEEEAENI